MPLAEAIPGRRGRRPGRTLACRGHSAKPPALLFRIEHGFDLHRLDHPSGSASSAPPQPRIRALRSTTRRVTRLPDSDGALALFHGGRHFQSLAMCIDRGRGGVLGRVVGFGHGSKQRCLSGWSLGWFQAPLQHQLKSLVILLGIKSRHYLIDRTNSGGGRGSPPTISLIERAPSRSRYNDPYKDYLASRGRTT